MCVYHCFFFFFQAEDGIRDLYVTGVQTCALPISAYRARAMRSSAPPNPNPWRPNSDAAVSHVLVIANETAVSSALLDALRDRAADDDVQVTVIAPVSEPRRGYVVYDDTRRASAGRRLDRTLEALRRSSIPAQGFVVETSPVQAAKDALAQLEPV